MFTLSHRSLVYIVNGLIVISLIVGGLAPVQMAQAATKMATADAVESQGRMAEMAGGQRREQGRSEADEEAASLTVDISQEAEPAVVAPGEVVTYTVTARHTGYGLLRDLVVSDALPAGLVLVPHSESGFGYDPGAKALIWEIESLGPGATLTGTFQARVTGAAIGAVIVNEALASSRTITQTVIGQSVVEVAPPKGNRAAVAAGQGGWLRSEDGRVQVHLPPGAVNRQVEISYAEADMTLPDFLRHAFVLTAKDGNGEEVTDFGQPVEVVYRYTAQELVERDLNAASLYHWDEARGEWEVVPSTLEVGRGRLRAQLQHFSIYAEGGAEDTYLVEGQTTLRGAQPQLFTGAIGYSYDFRLPPGQGGLQPVLGLRYSSASHTPNSGHFSQVGFGWEPAGADWLYIPPGDQNATQPTLKLQGATYSLRQTGDGQWFAKEDPLLKIEALDCSFGACGEWRLHGRDGVEYTFGTAETSRSYYWKLCGQQGEGRRYVHLPLRRITDRAGNTVSFSWGEEVEPSGPGACWPKSYVRAIHLDRIEYDNSNVQIDFVYAQRLDFPEGYDQQLWRFYTQNRLQQLWVKAKSGGSYQTLRSYYLEYDSGPNPYVSQKVSNLSYIEQTANGQVMPRVEFGYSDSAFASQDEYGAMTWIRNGYGGEIAFSSDHRGSGATPHVLASMSLRSGMAGATEAVWRYQGYDWDASGEADKLAGGFKRMDVIGPDGSLTRYEFETILDVGGKFDHLAGRVKTVQVCDDANCGSGHVLSRLETTWLHQLPANYPHLSDYGSLAPKDQPKFVYKEVEIAFKGEEEQSKTVLKYQDFRQKDEANVSRQYGNLTEVQEIEWDANTGGWKSAPYRTTYSVFYPATSAWIIDKPGLQEVFRKTWDDSSGQRLVQTFLFYDQTSNYQARPSQGLLRRTQTGLGSLWQDTYFEYWSHGSLYKTTDALGGSTRTFYDPDFGAYVLCQENALGQEVQYRYYGVSGGNRVGADGASCNPASGSGLDAANGRVFGALEEEKDANGAITTYSYDRWQRLVGVWRPGESKAAGHGASERVVYPAFMGGGGGGYAAPFVVRSGRRDDAGGGAVASYLESWRVYDGLGQVIQTQTEAATSGQRNVVDVWYDGQGRRVKASIAYAAAAAGDVSISPQAQAHTDYAYDGLGRTTTITNTDLSVTRSFYSAVAGGERTAVIDANQHQTIREVDGFGRLRWSRQYEGSFGAGPNWSATVYAEAAYGYDEFDRLVEVTGPGDAPTSLTYDALGRKTSLTDADMGLWSYGYDAAGNLTRQTDAKNQRTCFYYDALNRLKGKTYSSGTSACPSDPGSYTVSYSYDAYDGATQFGRGRRTGMVDGSGSTSWVYDQRGRTTSETKQIDKAGYTFNITYDAADRVKTIQYPDAEIVTNAYGEQGLPKSVITNQDANTKYLESAVYDPSGRPIQQVLRSSSTVTRTISYSYYPWSTPNGVGRLQSIQVSGLQNLTYTYDAVGNVKTIVDAINASQSQCFVYDELNRLKQGFTGDCQNPQYLPTGNGPYDEQYTYAANGNLDRRKIVKPAWQDNWYTYNALVSGCTAGTPALKPHAVSQAGSNTFGYDCNGNMSGRTVGGNSYTLSYDAENRLSAVSGAAVASFVYDGDGGRSKAVFGSGDNREIVRYFGNRLESKTMYVEDFDNEDWVEQSGNWQATGGVYKQSLTTANNTNSYRALAQGAGLEIRWKMTFVSGTQAGLYLMASAGTGTERGNSYRVWQDASYVYIYEAVNNNAGAYKIRFNATNTVGSSHDYVVRYLTNGRLVVWRDGVNLGGWTDATPLTTGAYLSLRTDGSGVDFDDIEVSRFKKYYDAGGQRLAMRDANTLSLLFSDHLGSTSLTVNASGVRTGELWYKPWGEYRGTAFGTTPTTFRYTGQREDASIGLYFYGARYYDPVLGRFIQADTVVPQPGNPQSLNRYSYVGNRPLNLVDPSGQQGLPPGIPNPYNWVGQQVTGFDSSQLPAETGLQDLTTDIGKAVVEAIDKVNQVLVPAVEFLLGLFPGYDVVTAIAGSTITGEQLSPGRRAFVGVLGLTAVGELGSVNKVAFGLGRPRGAIGRFAQKVDAATYWDLYENTSDLNVMGKQLMDMMNGSQEIHFNLDGMIGKGQTIQDIARMGQEGLSEGNITNWELYTILTNQDFFRKAIFYLDGKVYQGVEPLIP